MKDCLWTLELAWLEFNNNIIQQATGKLGWETGTLIHDAIYVQRKSSQDPTERSKLERVVETALFEEMEERGWARGAARAKVTQM